MAASLHRQFLSLCHVPSVLHSISHPTRCICSTPALLRKGQRIKRADAEVPLQKVKPKKEPVITRKASKGPPVPKPLHMLEIHEKFAAKRPEDDVWFTRHYPTQYFTFEEAIEMHRQANRVSMFNNARGLVILNVLLSMRTKKKTKFTRTYQGMAQLPHHFETNKPKPSLIVFSEDITDINDALQRGAKFAGGSFLIRQIETGEIDLNEADLDTCLSTLTILPEVLKIKEKIPSLPNKGQGTTGLPVNEMLDKHLDGFKYQTVPHESLEPSVSWLRAPIGTLDMDLSQLEENWKSWQQLAQKHYPLKDEVVIQAQCSVPPSDEIFEIRLAGQDMWGQREKTKHSTLSSDSVRDIEEVDDDEREAEG